MIMSFQIEYLIKVLSVSILIIYIIGNWKRLKNVINKHGFMKLKRADNIIVALFLYQIITL